MESTKWWSRYARLFELCEHIAKEQLRVNAMCKYHSVKYMYTNQCTVSLRDNNTFVSMMSLLHRLIAILMNHWYQFLEQLKHNCCYNSVNGRHFEPMVFVNWLLTRHTVVNTCMPCVVVLSLYYFLYHIHYYHFLHTVSFTSFSVSCALSTQYPLFHCSVVVHM